MNQRYQNQTIEIKSVTPKKKIITQQLKQNLSKPELRKFKMNISKYIYSSKKKLLKPSRSINNKIDTFGITNENSEESINSDEYISSTNLDVETNTYIHEQTDKVSENEKPKNNNVYSKGRVISILDDRGKPKKLLKGANKYKKINTNVKFKDYFDDKSNSNNISYKRMKINTNDMKKNIVYKKDEKILYDNNKISIIKTNTTNNSKKNFSRNKNNMNKINVDENITNNNSSNITNTYSVNNNKKQYIDTSKSGKLGDEINNIYYATKIKKGKNRKKNAQNINNIDYSNNYNYKPKYKNSKKLIEQLNPSVHTNNMTKSNNNYNKNNESGINNINNNNIIFSPLKVININIENRDKTPIQINRRYVQSNMDWISFIYPNERANKENNKNKLILINKNNFLSADKFNNKNLTRSEKELKNNSNKFKIKKNYSYIKNAKKNHFSISPKYQNLIFESYLRYDTLNNHKNKNKSFINKKDIFVNKTNKISNPNDSKMENNITNNSKAINNNYFNDTNSNVTYSFYIKNQDLIGPAFNKKIDKNSDIILVKNNSKAKYKHNHSLSSFNSNTINNSSSLYSLLKSTKNFSERDGINNENESNDHTHKSRIKSKYVDKNTNNNLNNINSNKERKINDLTQKLLNDKKRINFKKQIIPLKANNSKKFNQFCSVSPNNMLNKINKGRCNNYITDNFYTINPNNKYY